MEKPGSKIIGLYIGLIRRPYRFVVRRRISARIEFYELHHPASLSTFIGEILDVFSKESSSFMQLLAQIDDQKFMASKHKTRRYIAESKELLYIDNPKLASQFAAEHSGYWFITNIGAKEASKICHMAAQAANVPCESISKLSL